MNDLNQLVAEFSTKFPGLGLYVEGDKVIASPRISVGFVVTREGMERTESEFTNIITASLYGIMHSLTRKIDYDLLSEDLKGYVDGLKGRSQSFVKPL